MPIESDRWIGEQAIEHRMIEPFSGKQVRIEYFRIPRNVLSICVGKST
jgi:deoxycytidine triphosphate deaminase